MLVYVERKTRESPADGQTLNNWDKLSHKGGGHNEECCRVQKTRILETNIPTGKCLHDYDYGQSPIYSDFFN